MVDNVFETPTLDKMSLRRSLWRARMAARAIHGRINFTEPERSATAFLRDQVRASLWDTARTEIEGCPVYLVDSDWQSAVLKNDPCVLCVEDSVMMADVLDVHDPLEVMALRSSALTIERLRSLCPAGMRDKTVFLEV